MVFSCFSTCHAYFSWLERLLSDWWEPCHQQNIWAVDHTERVSHLYRLHVTGHGGGARARGLIVGLGVVLPGWSIGGSEVVNRVHLWRDGQSEGEDRQRQGDTKKRSRRQRRKKEG